MLRTVKKFCYMILTLDELVNFVTRLVWLLGIRWISDDLLLTLSDIVPRHNRFSPIAATGYLKLPVSSEWKAGQV